MAEWKKKVFSSLGFLTVCIVLYLNGVAKLKENAFRYPRGILICCMVCCVILLIQGIVELIKSRKDTSVAGSPEQSDNEENVQKQISVKRNTVITITVCCVITLVYILSIRYIGYILSTVLFIAGMLYYLRIRKIWVIAVTSIGVTAFLYFMFNNLLMVTLPVGSLFYNLIY